MIADDVILAKHSNMEARRRRFDQMAKRGGHGGASLCRMRPDAIGDVKGGLRMHLEIDRPEGDEEGFTLVSELEETFPGLASGEEVPTSMADAVVEMLESSCLEKSSSRSADFGDVTITTYKVKGTGFMAPNAEAKRRLEQKKAADQVLLVEKYGEDGSLRLRTYCQSNVSSERVYSPSLLGSSARFAAIGSGKGGIERITPGSAFCPSFDEETGLADWCEVDLGRTCGVTHVSTWGRFPVVLRTDKETGSRVIDPSSAGHNQWVTKYEVAYRVHGGKKWIELGTFKGNSDMTTEVAHEVVLSRSKPLVCRYLRFRPLAWSNAPAFRVGVYGTSEEDKDDDFVRLGQDGEDADGRMQPEVVDPNLIITYSVHKVNTSVNRNLVDRRLGLYRYGCARCSKNRGGMCKSSWNCPSASKQRGLRRAAAGVEAREVKGSIEEEEAEEQGEVEVDEAALLRTMMADFADLMATEAPSGSSVPSVPSPRMSPRAASESSFSALASPGGRRSRGASGSASGSASASASASAWSLGSSFDQVSYHGLPEEGHDRDGDEDASSIATGSWVDVTRDSELFP